MEPLENTNTDPKTQAIAEKYVGLRCWLDNKPARVAGRQKKFATIATDDGSQNVEFSWEAVDRIMSVDREFASMPDDKPKTPAAPKPKQHFSIVASVQTPHDAKEKFTEAKVKAWLKKQLKDCPFGVVVISDVIDMTKS